MLLHFWNIGNRNSLALRASQNQGWNKEEIFAIAQKYFDTKELLTFEEEFNYGFETVPSQQHGSVTRNLLGFGNFHFLKYFLPKVKK